MDYSSVTEQLVVKRPSSGDGMKKFFIGFAAVFLTLGIIFISVMLGVLPLGFLLSCGIGYGGYYFLSSEYIEYEYSVFEGELDIDKIIAKRKRKHMITIKIADFESFEVTDSFDEGSSTATSVFAMGDEGEHWIADFKHPEHGETRLHFTPDERLVAAITPCLSRTRFRSSGK